MHLRLRDHIAVSITNKGTIGEEIVAGQAIFHMPRRLPVFFVLDTSARMGGTFQVTMQEGLLLVKRELQAFGDAFEHAYIGSITSGGLATSYSLAPLPTFTPPYWQAGGECDLAGAFMHLADALSFDLLLPRSGHPGDYPPLVFLILGSEPSEQWTQTLEQVGAVLAQRQPLVLSLVTDLAIAEKVKAISRHIFLLQSAEALFITYYFSWTARTIARIWECYSSGISDIRFPDLPYGIVMPPDQLPATGTHGQVFEKWSN